MRQSVRVLIATVIVLIVAPSVAHACDAGARTSARARPAGGGRAPLVIGDSTMIFATPFLGRLGFEADAHGCRQYAAGATTLAGRARGHTLPRLAVLALGANGDIGLSTIEATLRAIGPGHVLGLVTPRNHVVTQHAMRVAARRYPDRVLLIDWQRLSAGRSFFAADGLHVDMAGARVYAQTIRRAAEPFFLPRRVRGLVTGAGPDGGKDCGAVHRAGHALRVRVVDGARSVTCTRVRAVARRAPLRRHADWLAYDGPGARLAGVANVFVNAGGGVVFVTRER